MDQQEQPDQQEPIWLITTTSGCTFDTYRGFGMGFIMLLLSRSQQNETDYYYELQLELAGCTRVQLHNYIY